MEQHCRTEFNQVNRVSFLIHHRYSYFLSLKKNVYLYTYIETSKADRERERERERKKREKEKKVFLPPTTNSQKRFFRSEWGTLSRQIQCAVELNR